MHIIYSWSATLDESCWPCRFLTNIRLLVILMNLSFFEKRTISYKIRNEPNRTHIQIWYIVTTGTILRFFVICQIMTIKFSISYYNFIILYAFYGNNFIYSKITSKSDNYNRTNVTGSISYKNLYLLVLLVLLCDLL